MEDWTIKKLDVSVEFPDVLDLAALKGHGVQPDEELLPNEGTVKLYFCKACSAVLIALLVMVNGMRHNCKNFL